MNERFDVSGPVRHIEQRMPVRSILERFRTFENFDVDFGTTGQILRITRRNNDGSVCSSELNFFDSTGALVRTEFLDAQDDVTGSTEFQYNSAGQAAGWLELKPDGSLIRRCENQFKDGRLIHACTALANGMRVIERDFTYSGDALTQRLTRYYAAGGSLSEQSVTTYDSQGRVCETWGLTPTGEPLGDGRYRYAYDAQGRQSKILSFSEWETNDIPNSIWLIEYDSDEMGNWVRRRKRHQFKGDAPQSADITHRTLTYWSG